MDKNKSIAALQAYATGLAAQSLQHKAESKIFAAQGYTKLAEKYAEHSAEEMGWVEQFMDRILDLGGEIKQEAQEAKQVYTDIVEFIEADYNVS